MTPFSWVCSLGVENLCQVLSVILVDLIDWKSFLVRPQLFCVQWVNLFQVLHNEIFDLFLKVFCQSFTCLIFFSLVLNHLHFLFENLTFFVDQVVSLQSSELFSALKLNFSWWNIDVIALSSQLRRESIELLDRSQSCVLLEVCVFLLRRDLNLFLKSLQSLHGLPQASYIKFLITFWYFLFHPFWSQLDKLF